MPRPGRIAVEGGVYHVYNRIGRGERTFDDEAANWWQLVPGFGTLESANVQRS